MHRRTVLKLPALLALPAPVPRLVAFGDSTTDDGVHPNDAGHAQIAGAFAPLRLWLPIATKSPAD